MGLRLGTLLRFAAGGSGEEEGGLAIFFAAGAGGGFGACRGPFLEGFSFPLFFLGDAIG
jgi:hypothetical protein